MLPEGTRQTYKRERLPTVPLSYDAYEPPHQQPAWHDNLLFELKTFLARGIACVVV